MNSQATWREVGKASWRLGRAASHVLALQARKLNQQAAAAVLARVEACNAHLAAPEPVSGRTEVSVGEHIVA